MLGAGSEMAVWGPRVALLLLVFPPLRCQEDGEHLAHPFHEPMIRDSRFEGPLPDEVPHFPPDQLRKLHSMIDSNGDGKVSLEETMRYSHSTGKEIAAKDVVQIKERMKLTTDGGVALEDHLSYIRSIFSDGDARKELETAKFKAADANGDGLIDDSELPSLSYPETHEAVMAVVIANAMRSKDSDKDGVLTMREFWASDFTAGRDYKFSTEEKADFALLDKDGDGVLNLDELGRWESGRFHTETTLKKFFEAADKDGDMHMTAAELVEGAGHMETTDSQMHFMQWANHHEL